MPFFWFNHPIATVKVYPIILEGFVRWGWTRIRTGIIKNSDFISYCFEKGTILFDYWYWYINFLYVHKYVQTLSFGNIIRYKLKDFILLFLLCVCLASIQCLVGEIKALGCFTRCVKRWESESCCWERLKFFSVFSFLLLLLKALQKPDKRASKNEDKKDIF